MTAHRALSGLQGVHGLDDLEVYLGAVGSFRHGFGLYTFHTVGIGDAFTYPPFAALVIMPLTFIPYGWAAVLWTCACLACTALIAVVSGREVARNQAPGVLGDAVLSSGLVLSAIAVSAPLASNLRFGQISFLIAALVLADLLCLRRTRAGGVLVGVAAAIKLTPLIFVPYLWLTGRRAVGVAAAAFAACAVVAWASMSHESGEFWLSVIFQGDEVHAFASKGNISLDAALRRLGLHGGVHRAVWVPLCLAVVVISLRRAALASRAGDHFAAAIVIGAASLVVSPISWTHHQIWLVLAAFAVVRRPERRLFERRFPVQALWAAAVLSIMTLPLAELRPWLAIAVAVLVPFQRPEPRIAEPMPPLAIGAKVGVS
ncbi:glycosyltransferase 87 family protein [Actinomadura syzygii]|uniref:DUF2029 domain-containing protein n=1 Tax=Actinomadura syzygii TaxID=1427538 RepID=A0A5D0U6H4_9ACTN|nr:glycosyltransferase 87 family protein [Actinomadura syzygii]TYC13222.1 DUF2029 domain-containing protein [Actinomadura syzygii]